MISKKQILIVSLLVILVAGLWGYKTFFIDNVIAHEFVGEVVEKNNNQITLDGVFVVKEHPELSQAEYKQRVVITLGNETKLVKRTLYLPTIKEVQQMGGRYTADQLKNEYGIGSIDDITVKLGLRVKSSENIYNKSSFTPDEVIYIEPIYPQE